MILDLHNGVWVGNRYNIEIDRGQQHSTRVYRMKSPLIRFVIFGLLVAGIALVGPREGGALFLDIRELERSEVWRQTLHRMIMMMIMMKVMPRGSEEDILCHEQLEFSNAPWKFCECEGRYDPGAQRCSSRRLSFQVYETLTPSGLKEIRALGRIARWVQSKHARGGEGGALLFFPESRFSAPSTFCTSPRSFLVLSRRTSLDFASLATCCA